MRESCECEGGWGMNVCKGGERGVVNVLKKCLFVGGVLSRLQAEGLII